MLLRVLIAVVLFAGSQGIALAQERILRFVSDVTVQTSGDLDVTETITVLAEGREIRRGILRDFPTSYRGRDGRFVEVGFQVLSVIRDGQAEDFASERYGNGIRTRIGNASRLLDRGPHTYVIRYRTTRQIGFLQDFDELYWNATGNGWTFTIDQAEARITLPEGAKIRQNDFYTGEQGAQEKAAFAIQLSENQIAFRAIRSLPPKNGLTVAVAWQKGIVLPPTTAQLVGYFLRDNIAFSTAFIGLLIVGAYFVVAWLTVGRDPPKGVIIPLFAPPEGMSAAGMRYLDQRDFDTKAFTAAIVELGVKGNLKLTEEGGTTNVKRITGGRHIGAAEDALMKKLFARKGTIELKQDNHADIGGAKTAIQEIVERAYYGKLFKKNYGWWWIGVLIAAGFTIAIAVALGQSYGSNASTAVLALLLPMIPVMLGAGCIYLAFKEANDKWIPVTFGILLGIVPAIIGIGFAMAEARGWVDVVPLGIGYVTAALTAVALPWLEAPSREGRKLLDHIDGFREYLGVAEEERLEFMNPPKKTPELFERFLPYAIALDVENSWAKKFTAILAAAAASAATGAAYTTSRWYSGSRDWSTDPVSMTGRISNSLVSTISSSSYAPGSSGGSSGSSGGSSGGGSSGGGGGGGGGSGW